MTVFRVAFALGFAFAGFLSLAGWEAAQSDALTHYGGIVAGAGTGLGVLAVFVGTLHR